MRRLGAQRGDRESLPLSWHLIAALTIGLGLAAAVQLQPWTRDFLDWRRVLQAGGAWAAGQDPYGVSGYFYTPALAVVASWLPDWSTAIVVIGGLLTAIALAPRQPVALIAVLCYPPVWGDLALGNVTILLVGAVVLAIGEDSSLRALPLGVGLALVPKPMFMPVLLWMAVHRRKSLRGVIAAGVAVTLPALTTGLYPDFVGALVRGITPVFDGNLGITFWMPWAGIPVSAAALLVSVAAARREETGLIVAGIAATVIGTYVGLYAPVLPAALLQRYARFDVRRAQVLAAIGSIAWFGLPLAAVAAFAVALWPFPFRAFHARSGERVSRRADA